MLEKGIEVGRQGKISTISKVTLVVGLAWTVVLAGFLAWSVKNVLRHTRELVLYQARAFFQEIVTTRYWNATHGGVYVPVTDETKPNPYLDDPHRDVMTDTGLALTKINPAYMTRQIGEIASERNLVWFHITSANPIRPANAPDAWESDVLKSFSSGFPELAEFTASEDGKRVFRYMAPLWVEQQCLKCHIKQGYEVGDLRGGISVTIQADPMVALQNRQIRNVCLTCVVIWAFGLLGIRLASRSLTQAEQKRENLIRQLHSALAQVKKLSGLLPICASCKKIRDDKGYWSQIESYVRDHSEAEFSHSICPECAKQLYPGLHSNDE